MQSSCKDILHALTSREAVHAWQQSDLPTLHVIKSHEISKYTHAAMEKHAYIESSHLIIVPRYYREQFSWPLFL